MSHHFPAKSPKNVVVIGGGMGGLAAAARLAKKGHKVTLFEAGSRLGGKCQTERLGEFSFDTGPSLLTLPAVYRDLFIKTGKRLEHLLELKPVDPAFEYIFHDGTRIQFPNLSHNGTVGAITEVLGTNAGNDWHNLLERAESMWEASRESFIEGELRSIWPFLISILVIYLTYVISFVSMFIDLISFFYFLGMKWYFHVYSVYSHIEEIREVSGARGSYCILSRCDN